MTNEYIKVFSDKNDERRTFEVCLYGDNKDICDELFGGRVRTLSVESYMLANKAESAFMLASKEPDGFIVPDYINVALKWIKG